jgi:hypothetical protein
MDSPIIPRGIAGGREITLTAWEDHGFCVGTGPDGDEIVSNITNPMHALGAKDVSGTCNRTTGTGKLAGVSGGGTYDCQSGEFKTTVPGTYVAYCTVQGKYKLH